MTNFNSDPANSTPTAEQQWSRGFGQQVADLAARSAVAAEVACEARAVYETMTPEEEAESRADMRARMQVVFD